MSAERIAELKEQTTVLRREIHRYDGDLQEARETVEAAQQAVEHIRVRRRALVDELQSLKTELAVLLKAQSSERVPVTADVVLAEQLPERRWWQRLLRR